MDCRLDTPSGNQWRHGETSVVFVDNQIEQPNVVVNRNSQGLDMTADFAARLTRLSNLLGVVLHMVRVDLLTLEEQQRLEQINALARAEIVQANLQLKALERQEQGFRSTSMLDAAAVLRSVLDSFAVRLQDEDVHVIECLSESRIEMEALVLRSLLTGILHFALERLSIHDQAHRILQVEVATCQEIVCFTLKTNGPFCAESSSSVDVFCQTAGAWDPCLERSIHLASEMGGSLSVRSWPSGESRIQLDLPARRTAR